MLRGLFGPKAEHPVLEEQDPIAQAVAEDIACLQKHDTGRDTSQQRASGRNILTSAPPPEIFQQ